MTIDELCSSIKEDVAIEQMRFILNRDYTGKAISADAAEISSLKNLKELAGGIIYHSDNRIKEIESGI